MGGGLGRPRRLARPGLHGLGAAGPVPIAYDAVLLADPHGCASAFVPCSPQRLGLALALQLHASKLAAQRLVFCGLRVAAVLQLPALVAQRVDLGLALADQRLALAARGVELTLQRVALAADGLLLLLRLVTQAVRLQALGVDLPQLGEEQVLTAPADRGQLAGCQLRVRAHGPAAALLLALEHLGCGGQHLRLHHALAHPRVALDARQPVHQGLQLVPA
mmetsp:Transcript_8911/g.27664  ORF Transcript_8911/g.27664 Transcript_8911/m.27664 type:complete len:220 (+) Transcript_8911:443-1102(+)